MNSDLLKKLAKTGAAHKYDYGHALVLAGGAGRTGAARLAARGALRVGAGLVTLGPPGAALMECAVQSTAVMVRRCDDAAGLADLLKDRRINALCLGPGTGVDRAKELLPPVLARFADAEKGGVVLDADALTALGGPDADAGGGTGALQHRLFPRAVLTPHGGEFARLFPGLSQDDLGVQEAAGRSGAIVLLKGATTYIATPDGSEGATVIADAPWLATAGSGDALSGLITGLLARGFTPFDAALAGAELHGACGRAFGAGLIAEDLPEMLPKVFRSLGL